MMNTNNKVIKQLAEAPVSSEVIVPTGYALSYDNGIQEVRTKKGKNDNIKESRKTVATSPILITGRLENINNRKENLRLSFFRNGYWKHHIVERSKVYTTREITLLADYGVDVSSINSKHLVKYLSLFEAENNENIPNAQVTNHLGWQENRASFLWGRKFFRKDGDDVIEIETEQIDAQHWNKNLMFFKGNDDGDEQIARAYYSKGSYKKWIDAINSIHKYPKVMGAVYISLVAPFLDILKAENFTIDFANSTSTGKTTTLRIAASCWGNPDERSSSSVLHTWDATYVWIENCASILNGLPLFLDDTKLAGTGSFKGKAADKVSKVIYAVANGRGRERGSIKGTRETGSWRTVLLSSGEQSAVDFTEDGGTRGRVIISWGGLFDGSIEQAQSDTASFVKQVNMAVQENFGHAAPRIIRYILENDNKWAEWRKSYLLQREKRALNAGNNEIAGRVSDYFAAIMTVIPIIHKALPELQWSKENVINILEEFKKATITGSKEADRHTEALHQLYSWAASNESSFYYRHDDNGRIPNNGWAGAWKRDISFKDKWTEIAFRTFRVRDLLTEWGFEAKATIAVWRDRKWLNTDKSGRGKQVKIDKNPLYCYCIKRAVLEKQLNLNFGAISE